MPYRAARSGSAPEAHVTPSQQFVWSVMSITVSPSSPHPSVVARRSSYTRTLVHPHTGTLTRTLVHSRKHVHVGSVCWPHASSPRLFCLHAVATYVFIVVVLSVAAIAFVSIASSLVAIAVVVAVAPGYLVSFFIACCRRRRGLPGHGLTLGTAFGASAPRASSARPLAPVDVAVAPYRRLLHFMSVCLSE